MTDLPEEISSRPARKPGQEATATLTLDAYRRLKTELDDLRSRGRDEMGKRLLVAREHGDIRENAEYDAAKNEQALMESRIRTIERMLRDPDIVGTPVEGDVVAPGMLVTIKPLDDDEDEEETYLLADSAEERQDGVRTITTTSPLGSALIGTKPGDEIAYEAPGGAFRCSVVRFEPRP
ncbi:MAG: GreA/GreB family elongation factor [Actinomycetota bacterium]